MRSYERLPTRYEAVPRLVPAQCIARLWRRSAGIATRRISAITVASIVDRAAGLVQRRLEVGDCWCTGPDRIEAQALSSLSQFQQWRRLWLFCHDALPRRQQTFSAPSWRLLFITLLGGAATAWAHSSK